MRSLMLAAAAATATALAQAAPLEGTLLLDNEPVAVRHVTAHLHDNAEGQNATPLAIAFTDRPLPAGALEGPLVWGIQQLARAGAVRGLLLRLDPSRPTQATLTVLEPPADERTSLLFISLAGNGAPVIQGLAIKDGRVRGEFRRSDDEPGQMVHMRAALRFDASLAREPAVVADLKGGAARSSAPWKAADAWNAALAKGDLARIRSLAGPAMLGQLDAMARALGGDAALAAMMKKQSPMARKQLAAVDRVVERPGRAILLSEGGGYISMVKVDGAWKMGG